jgi:hypothetical protein
MSLSLYIIRHIPIKHRGGGRVREWEDNELFYCNVTHNLTEMACHVPIEGTDGSLTLPRDYERDDPNWKPGPLTAYNLLWHPETNPLLRQMPRDENNSDDDDFVIAVNAELVRQACAVYRYIAVHREELSKHNPSNGWGSYDSLLRCSGEVAKALQDIPAEEHGNYYLYCST